MVSKAITSRTRPTPQVSDNCFKAAAKFLSRTSLYKSILWIMEASGYLMLNVPLRWVVFLNDLSSLPKTMQDGKFLPGWTTNCGRSCDQFPTSLIICIFYRLWRATQPLWLVEDSWTFLITWVIPRMKPSDKTSEASCQCFEPLLVMVEVRELERAQREPPLPSKEDFSSNFHQRRRCYYSPW